MPRARGTRSLSRERLKPKQQQRSRRRPGAYHESTDDESGSAEQSESIPNSDQESDVQETRATRQSSRGKRAESEAMDAAPGSSPARRSQRIRGSQQARQKKESKTPAQARKAQEALRVLKQRKTRRSRSVRTVSEDPMEADEMDASEEDVEAQSVARRSVTPMATRRTYTGDEDEMTQPPPHQRRADIEQEEYEDDSGAEEETEHLLQSEVSYHPTEPEQPHRYSRAAQAYAKREEAAARQQHQQHLDDVEEEGEEEQSGEGDVYDERSGLWFSADGIILPGQEEVPRAEPPRAVNSRHYQPDPRRQTIHALPQHASRPISSPFVPVSAGRVAMNARRSLPSKARDATFAYDRRSVSRGASDYGRSPTVDLGAGFLRRNTVAERCRTLAQEARDVIAYYSRLTGAGSRPVDVGEAWRVWGSLSGEHVCAVSKSLAIVRARFD